MPNSKKFPGELQEGDLVGGSCTILDYIGRGAMGHVYRVRHNALNAEYALKMLSADQVNEESSRLFKREAHAITILSHPNVVRIYDLGLHDGKQPFYAMELLVGTDLGKKIRDSGPIEAAKAASIFIEVCAGMSYSHSKGMVHRDIKPSNIFILDKPGASGEKVKVVDFGVVNFAQAKYPESQGNDVLGTPYYMSPEQCMAQRVDGRSDIYSLGCSLFETLTGNLPFRAKSPTEIMHMHASSPPPTLSASCGGKEFPAAMEAIIAKAMAKAPADRYQTMDEMSRDLSNVIDAAKWSMAVAPGSATNGKSAQSSTLPGGMTAKTKALAVVALVVIGLVFVGGFTYWRSQAVIKGTKPPHLTEPAKIFRPTPGKANNIEPSDELPKDQKVTASLMLKKPFSSSAIVAGKMFRQFDMPKDVVVGLFKTRVPNQQVQAVGILKYPVYTHITFTPTDVVGRYPDCLKRFQPDDIYAITFFPAACTDEIFKATLNLSDVRRLSFAGCKGLTEASCETLKGFHNLQSFDASDSNLSGALLAKAGCWDKLDGLSFSSANDVAPLLKELTGVKTLRRLSLSKSSLTAQDFQALANLPHLNELDLFQVKMTKQDLATLGTLKNLTELQIGETGLTGADLDSINNFKYLSYLDLCGNHITKEQLANLITLGEFSQLDLQDTDLDASIVEVLKHYSPLKKLRIASKNLKPGDLAKIKEGLPLVTVF